jgi:hypothetical protein
MDVTRRWLRHSRVFFPCIVLFWTYGTIVALSGSPEGSEPKGQQEQVEERGVPLPQFRPPLPDVTASIDQEWMDVFHAQYKAEIKIVNKGNVPMPPVQVLTLGMRYNPLSTPPNPSQCIANNNCTIRDQRTVSSLGPDQSKKYKVDPKFTAAETVIVEVTILCNPPNNCAELNGSNNKVRKVLGPH